MNSKYRSIFASLVFALFLFYSGAQADENTEQNVRFSLKSASFAENKTIEQFLADSSTQMSELPTVNFGLSKNVLFIYLKIHSPNDLKDQFLLIPTPLLDSLTIYQKGMDGFKKVLIEGQSMPYSQRDIQTKGFAMQLNPEMSELVLRIRSEKPVAFPIRIVDQQELNKYNSYFLIFSGVFFGIIFIMAAYNLFVFFSVRDKSYLYYVIYILLLGFTQGALQGTFDKFIWSNSAWSSFHMVPIGGALVGMFSLVFVRSFLHLKQTMPIINKVFSVLISLEVIAFLLVFFDQNMLSYNLINATAGIGAIFATYSGVVLYKRGNKSALFFLIGWGVFIISVLMFVIKDYFTGVTPEWLNYVILVGASLEVVLLSFALADKINTYRKEVQISQQKALEASQLNEKLIKEQNIVLEARVKERTSELEEANENLTSALGSLKEAQSQLVEVEKMASLGQLTAGIAHEINNPINFVSSNVKPIQQDIADIFSLVEDVQAFMEEKGYTEGLDFLKDKKDSYDYTFLQDELSMLVTGLKDGADRTIEIVRGLKTFSRLDESDLKKVNLIEGLESTLILLRNKYKDAIHIEKNYEQIPEVECLGGKMNQVFMNIITNGIQALTEHPEIKDPTLFISTKQLGDFVLISVKDNGPGIPQDVKERIFEPFFTTKPVGQGTGLGLSIVYKIIESHGGTLDVVSEPGQGAEFRITLPIENNNNL